MGISTYPKVVFGIPFDASKTFSLSNVRGCEHTITPEANFCPQCGKPHFVNQKVFLIEKINAHAETSGTPLSSEWSFGLHLFNNDFDSTKGVLGFAYYSNDDLIKVVEPPPEIKDYMTGILKEFNISSKELSLYSFCYYSM